MNKSLFNLAACIPVLFMIHCTQTFLQLMEKEKESILLDKYGEPVLNITASEASVFLNSQQIVNIQSTFKVNGKEKADELNVIENLDYKIEINDDSVISVPVIFIDKSGRITPNAIGKVKITAYYEYKKKSYKSNTLLFEVRQTSKVLTINVIKSSTFPNNPVSTYVEVTFEEEGTDKTSELEVLPNLIYTISRTDAGSMVVPVISIDSAGKISPISIGTVDIMASFIYDGETIDSNTLSFEVKPSGAGITVSQSSLTIGENASQSFTVVLDAVPTADVSLDLSTALSSELIITPASITFTPEDFDQPQNVEIFVINDDVANDIPIVYIINFADLSSSDLNYDGLSFPQINVKVVEDDTHPIATPLTPFNGELNVNSYKQILVSFDKPMDPITQITSNFIVEDSNGDPVNGFINYNPDTLTTGFILTDFLKFNASYTATLTTDMQDIFSNPLAAEKTWSFNTGLYSPDEIAKGVSSTYSGSRGYGITISGRYAYVADGTPGFRVYDLDALGDPITPDYKTKITTPGSVSYGLITVGNYVYMANAVSATGSLMTIDVTNPLSPSLLDTDATSSIAYTVAVKDDYLYVVTSNALVTYSIVDPANPSQVDLDALTDGYIISISGNYAYVSNGYDGIEIFDIATTPGNPSHIANYPSPPDPNSNPSYTFGVTISGNYAYAVHADGIPGVSIIDISNPAVPVLASSIDPAGKQTVLKHFGDYLYTNFVTSSYSKLIMIDVSEPLFPREIGNFNIGPTSYWMDIAVQDGYVYITNYDWMITNKSYITVIKEPNTSLEIGEYATGGTPLGFFVLDNFAYIGQKDTNQLIIVNVTNPEQPSVYGSYDAPDWVLDLFVSDNKAYLMTNDTIEIIDVSDKSNPTFISTYTLASANPEAIFVAANTAYVAANSDGVEIIDVSNPLLPSAAAGGSYTLATDSKDIFISGNYGYVADNTNGLLIFDVLDPSTTVGSYAPAISVYKVFAYNNYIYLTAGSEMHVLDVSNPAIPEHRATYNLNQSVSSIFGSGNYIYTSNYSIPSVVNIIDVSNQDCAVPLCSLSSVDRLLIPTYNIGIFASKGYLYSLYNGETTGGGMKVFYPGSFQ